MSAQHTPGPWTAGPLTNMGCRITAKVGPLEVSPAIARGIDDVSGYSRRLTRSTARTAPLAALP